MKTAYLDRKVGDILPDSIKCYNIAPVDQVALQAGFLEEVRDYNSAAVYELAGYISGHAPFTQCHPDRCLPLAKSILIYLRGKMPETLIKTNAWGAGYNAGVSDCLKALGEGE